MNVEFMNLDDGKTIVTNEEGKIEKRDDTFSENELVLENKLEKINSEIERITEKKAEHERVIEGSKFMLVFQIIPLLFSMSVGWFMAKLYGLIYATLLGLIACGVNTLCWGIAKPISKRKVKGLTAELEKAEELKRIFEEKLESTKELPKEEVKNEPISLKNKNTFEIAKIEKDLSEAYTDAVRLRPKRRVLKIEKKER